MIEFFGGPMNGLYTDDLGFSTPKFCIYRKMYPNSRTECGYAIYERDPENDAIAHWSHNEWPGEYLVEEVSEL